MASYREALQLKEHISKKYLRHSGIHAIGIGRDPEHPHSGAAVIIYREGVVTANPGKQMVRYRKSSGQKISVPVIYKHTPKFRAHADAPSPYTKRVRPVVAGYSVGTSRESGTAGLIVKSSSSRQKYILSNNHVLNPNNTAQYTRTLQPGGADGGTNARDQVGRLDRFVKLSNKGFNYLDAATSIPTLNRLLSPTYALFGVIPGYVTSYRVGDRLKKVGRTSGLVTGTVDTVHTDVKVSYEGEGGLNNVIFKNQTVVKGINPVSLPGDSGSVWLTGKGSYAAAINYAGSTDGRLSIAYPVQWFMEVFGTTTATPNGSGIVKVVPIPAKDKRKYALPLTQKERKQIKLIKV